MSDIPSYVPPVGIGRRDAGACRGQSRGFPATTASRAGDYVSGLLGVQEHAVVDARGLNKVDPSLAPLPVYLSALGMPGLTAYFGLLDIGRPEPGQTVVVSGAAGAVGQIVGQIAKLKGARAIGDRGWRRKNVVTCSSSSASTRRSITSRRTVPAALRETCPDGIDVYFDNVGGEILDRRAGPPRRANARVVICGAVSQYNSTEGVRGPANYLSLLVHHASMTGFVVSDYGDPRRRSAPGTGRLAQPRRAQVTRGHRRRARVLSRRAADAVLGREHGQARRPRRRGIAARHPPRDRAGSALRSTPPPNPVSVPPAPITRMAGDDDRDWVAGVGTADRPWGRWRADTPSQLAVALGHAVRDLKQRAPDTALERAAARGERQIESLASAGEVLLKLSRDCVQARRRALPSAVARATGRGPSCM